jgi:hypothetical protein
MSPNQFFCKRDLRWINRADIHQKNYKIKEIYVRDLRRMDRTHRMELPNYLLPTFEAPNYLPLTIESPSYRKISFRIATNSGWNFESKYYPESLGVKVELDGIVVKVPDQSELASSDFRIAPGDISWHMVLGLKIYTYEHWLINRERGSESKIVIPCHLVLGFDANAGNFWCHIGNATRPLKARHRAYKVAPSSPRLVLSNGRYATVVKITKVWELVAGGDMWSTVRLIVKRDGIPLTRY